MSAGHRRLVVVRQHALVARARVEPHVEDVLLALELGVPALRAREALGQELLESGARTTRRRRSCSKTSPRLRDQFRREDGLAARRAVDGRDRHAPRPLARDAPVGAVREHVVDALLAPRGDPLHAAHRVERLLAQAAVFHRDEPLRRGQEDHRVVAAPAVRVLVLVRLVLPQRPRSRERLDDLRVRLEHAHARRTAPTSGVKCPPPSTGA